MLNWIYQHIGRKIKSARESMDITQDELAKSLNLKRTSISNIESGTQAVSIDALYVIAVETKKEIGDFLPNTMEVESYLTREVSEKVIGDESLDEDKRKQLLSAVEKYSEKD